MLKPQPYAALPSPELADVGPGLVDGELARARAVQGAGVARVGEVGAVLPSALPAGRHDWWKENTIKNARSHRKIEIQILGQPNPEIKGKK